MEEKNSYVGVCLPEIYVIWRDNTWKVYSIMASLNILLQVNNLKSILKSILSYFKHYFKHFKHYFQENLLSKNCPTYNTMVKYCISMAPLEVRDRNMKENSIWSGESGALFPGVTYVTNSTIFGV